MNAPLSQRVHKVLATVITDVDVETLAADINLRDQTDFDSMDTRRFAIGLKQEFGIDVPDADFPHLASIGKCIAYLQKIISR